MGIVGGWLEQRTLAWVADMTARHGLSRFNLFAKECVDALSHPSQAAPQRQMAQIAAELRLVGEARYDALLAGMAEFIAQRIDQVQPAWTDKPERFLPRPWFWGVTPPMRAHMLVETPGPFRRRNLFCGYVWLRSSRWAHISNGGGGRSSQ